MEKKYIKPTIVVEKVMLLTYLQENSGVTRTVMTKGRDTFDENVSGKDEKEYGEIQNTIW